MREIAEQHLNHINQEAPTTARIWQGIKAFTGRYGRTIGFGILSIALYGLLYWLSPDIKSLTQSTYAGHKQLFFIPIVIAFVFSLIHGTFTSHFWDSLGVKAKQT